ncbi:MAG: aldehyde dehydrogenase family protein [Bacteroidota bacterium]
MDAITIPTAPNTATNDQMTAVFEQQRAYASTVANSSVKERRAKLQRIADYTMEHLPRLEEAMHKDFKKPMAETVLTEILPIISDLKHTKKHLRKWMKPRRVPMPLTLLGTVSHIRYEAKGTILILSPWNYPFNLTIGPLISAIAAGNTAILKPSEMTPHTSAFMQEMIQELFDPKEVALFEGDVSVAQHLLSLPFNHIFFTGSPQVGKIVMKAAADHLASVTLELGGKSPTIIDETANLKTVAERVAWGKCVNNGQTCVAPDYVLVQESVKSQFIEQFGAAVKRMYGDSKEWQQSDSYARIVNQKHHARISGLLEDAIDKGANIEFGGQVQAEENFIAPTVLTKVESGMRVMQEEIFGPLLPVMSYTNKEEALQVIQQFEAPLVMYVNSRNQRNIDFFLNQAPSGDVVINETLAHFGHPDLPFGGKNNSGIGKSGGEAGFREFSHERSVLIQKFGTLKPFYPPYTPTVRKILGWVLKFL